MMRVTGCSGPTSGSTGMTGPIRGVTGMTGPIKGMTGVTGMTGAHPPPTCVSCHQTSFNLFEVDLNLDTKPKENEDIHLICEKCIIYTRKLIKKVKKQPLIKLPLLINHENIFIRHYVAERLKKGK